MDCLMDWTWDLRAEKEVDVGFWVQRLSIWVSGEDKWRREMLGFSLKPVTFVMNDLVSRKGSYPSLWSCPPTPVLGDLQFRAPWLRSTGMSQGGPTRRCKLSCLFISCSELVAVADFFGRNGRIRPQGTSASPSYRVGDCLLCSIHPRYKAYMFF